MIDIHVHLGTMFREGYPSALPLTVDQLMDHMDREGIERSVLLPLESPEGMWGYFLTEDAVRARDAYPERLLAFACADPRYPNAVKLLEHAVHAWGCVGFGEHVCGLAFDDPRCIALYAACESLQLPVLFEICDGLCWDDVGLPRLESCLQAFPDVTWIGHGPQFWSAISADDPRIGYPDGPITQGGALERFLADYDNLYADLSAGSGYNAMTRDPAYTEGFLARHWRKLLFGTDYLAPNQDLPIIPWLRGVGLDAKIVDAIAQGNARRVLKL